MAFNSNLAVLYARRRLPEDVRWSILGHEEETVAAGYGEGSRCRC
jgi:hypothetical protein